MTPLEMFPGHGFMGGHTHETTPHLLALAGHRLEWEVRHSSQVSCKRFYSGLQDDPTRDIPRARSQDARETTPLLWALAVIRLEWEIRHSSLALCKRFWCGVQDDPTRDVTRVRFHGRTHTIPHHFSEPLRAASWYRKRFCSGLQVDLTRDVTRVRFHGRTHTIPHHFSGRLRASSCSGKSDTRARYLASGSVQASRMTPLEMFPEHGFVGGHIRHHFSGRLAGIRLQWKIRHSSQVSCKRFCSGLKDEHPRDVSRARFHGRTHTTRHHFSGHLRAFEWSGEIKHSRQVSARGSVQASKMKPLQDARTFDVPRARFHGRTHTRRDTTSLGAGGIRVEWKNHTLETGFVQAVLFRPPALEVFPENGFMEEHTPHNTASLSACGHPAAVANQTLEPGIVQAILFRPPG